MEVSVQQSAVTTVERFQPGFLTSGLPEFLESPAALLFVGGESFCGANAAASAKNQSQA